MLYEHELKIKSLGLKYSEVDDFFIKEKHWNTEEAESLTSKYGWETNRTIKHILPDIIDLSKKYPNIIFELDTRNLEVDEYYRTYIIDGKYQTEQGYIVYDPMKEHYLQEL